MLALLTGVGCSGTAGDLECDAGQCGPLSIGGTVSGLNGTGLVLQNGSEMLPVAASGPFTFVTTPVSGTTYFVSVATQPTNPSQTCTVANASGTVGTSRVTSILVSCVNNSAPTFSLGGTVGGLSGTGLVLQNNGGDNRAISASGPFTFATALPTGSLYEVTVLTQPPDQVCTVSNGGGTIGTSNVTNVAVTCVSSTVPRYSVGGNVSGLNGSGLVLRNNGGDDRAISASGPFNFATTLADGSTYAVTVAAQPANPSQTCTVTSGSGTINGAPVTSVAVACVNDPIPRYTVGGTVSGLTGTGLVLQNNGGDNHPIGTNGAFTFATTLTSGSPYTVKVFAQPTGQTCTVANGSGTVSGADVSNVAVTCVTNTIPRYTIGGTVSGLGGSGLLLRNNGTDDRAITANGSFAFGTPLPSGATYSVVVVTQPTGPAQTCTVTNGSGTVGSAPVINVTVTCVTNPPPRFSIGGTVSGLSGSGLVLQNNGGDNRAITANGSFTFATQIATGSTYSVTVSTQPSNPTQTCIVANGSGTVGSAPVTNVTITCGSAPPSQPTLVQHVSSSTNIIGRGLTSNNFRFTLPNAVGVGNVLILGISYGVQSGRAATISDDRGNSWPSSPAVVVTDTGSELTSAIFVLPNAKAGTTTVTVSFNSAIDNQIFQYTISEFYGVATTAPVNGTSSSGNTTAPTLGSGSLTPGNNDAAGGNLIWTYFGNAGGADANRATHFGAGSGFTLLDADIAWPNGAPPFSHASEYMLQTAAATITPSMSLTQSGGNDRYTGVSVALKAASGAATSPPGGMRIVHLAHFTNQLPSAGAWNLQFPSSGNLIVMTLQETNLIPVSSVSDNLGNSYTQVQPDDSVPQFWYAQGPATTGSTLQLTVSLTGGQGAGVTYLLYDVAGASASSFDGVAHKSQYNDPTGSDVTDSPVITPASAPGLTITATSLGQGPSAGLAAGCPAGAVFDLVYYAGETDLDTMDNADFRAHVFNTDTSTQHWNIDVANGGRETNVSSTAVHFK